MYKSQNILTFFFIYSLDFIGLESYEFSGLILSSNIIIFAYQSGCFQRMVLQYWIKNLENDHILLCGNNIKFNVLQQH